MEIQVNPLRLSEQYVHSGMKVAICLDGKEQPEVDKNGKPLLLWALTGGIPKRRLFYPIPGGIKFSERRTAVVGDPMSGFKPEVRFMPLEVYQPESLPANREFVAYVQGEPLMYPSGRNRVYVQTDRNGRVVSSLGYEYQWYGREYSLPQEALLVPINHPSANPDNYKSR